MRYLRILFLVCVGIALMEPYLAHGTLGGGDTIKYSNGVADFLTQVRAGHFPVWIGQSDFSIFGGDFPPRFAPVLQHQSALVDILTGQRLPLFLVLNISLAVSFIGGLLSCYFCLNAVMPARPWAAMALAILYGSCPGVIGLPYTQDLYMSFSTLPFLPVVFLGIVRSFERNDALSRLLMAGGLAGTWLAHPPIAMWTGFAAVVTQCFRVGHIRYTRRDLFLDLLGGAAFFVLAGFSFVAAQSVSTQWWMPPVDANEIVFQIKKAFPGNWLPLRRDVLLENLQIGYGLTAIGIVSVSAFFVRRPDFLQVGLFVACGILSALVIPIPFITSTLWHLAPRSVLTITNAWPTQRLTVIIALCIVFGAALGLRQICVPSRLTNGIVGAALILAIAWGAFQCSRLLTEANRTAPSYATTRRMQLPENLVLSASTYGISTVPPRYASMGVMDPELEHHFLDPTTRELRGSASDAIEPGFGPGPKTSNRPLPDTFTGKLDANPGILDISPILRIEPGKRYLLALEFRDLDYSGVLIIRGSEFFREYRLPLSGEPRAFGSGPESSHIIPLWTSLNEPEDLQLQFVPIGSGRVPMDFVPFAHYELKSYAPSDIPVRLESLLPYRAKVRCSGPLYLETPKLFLPTYVATVDGVSTPVSASPDGYAMLPLNSGIHEVILRYVPSFAVRFSYWTGAAGWLCLVGALCLREKIFRQ